MSGVSNHFARAAVWPVRTLPWFHWLPNFSERHSRKFAESNHISAKDISISQYCIGRAKEPLVLVTGGVGHERTGLVL